jgi:hypothetical protein
VSTHGDAFSASCGVHRFSVPGPEGIGARSPLQFASAETGKRIVERMDDLIGARAKAMLP